MPALKNADAEEIAARCACVLPSRDRASVILSEWMQGKALKQWEVAVIISRAWEIHEVEATARRAEQ